MDNKLIQLNKSLQTKKIPKLSAGDIVRVHKKIKEGDKERVQVFKGLIIAIKGGQSSSPTITVRRESQGIGMEMIIPVFSSLIEKIELLRHSKVRRSKLYYMRDRTGKSAKMKARDFKDGELLNEEENQLEEGNKLDEKKEEKIEKKKENIDKEVTSEKIDKEVKSEKEDKQKEIKKEEESKMENDEKEKEEK